jgi:hypothetical protein
MARSTSQPPAGGGDAPPQPNQIPDVSTPPYAKVVSDAWMVEGMMQVQKALGELTSSVNTLKSASDKQGTKLDRISHLVFASGVVLTIILGVGAFLMNKMWDRVVHLIIWCRRALRLFCFLIPQPSAPSPPYPRACR